jgi:hypothetical protein
MANATSADYVKAGSETMTFLNNALAALKDRKNKGQVNESQYAAQLAAIEAKRQELAAKEASSKRLTIGLVLGGVVVLGAIITIVIIKTR